MAARLPRGLGLAPEIVAELVAGVRHAGRVRHLQRIAADGLACEVDGILGHVVALQRPALQA